MPRRTCIVIAPGPSAWVGALRERNRVIFDDGNQRAWISPDLAPQIFDWRQGGWKRAGRQLLLLRDRDEAIALAYPPGTTPATGPWRGDRLVTTRERNDLEDLFLQHEDQKPPVQSIDRFMRWFGAGLVIAGLIAIASVGMNFLRSGGS